MTVQSPPCPQGCGPPCSGGPSGQDPDARCPCSNLRKAGPRLTSQGEEAELALRAGWRRAGAAPPPQPLGGQGRAGGLCSCPRGGEALPRGPVPGSPGRSERVGTGARPDSARGSRCWAGPGSQPKRASGRVLAQLNKDLRLPWEHAQEQEDSAGEHPQQHKPRESGRRGAAERQRRGRSAAEVCPAEVCPAGAEVCPAGAPWRSRCPTAYSSATKR